MTYHVIVSIIEFSVQSMWDRQWVTTERRILQWTSLVWTFVWQTLQDVHIAHSESCNLEVYLYKCPSLIICSYTLCDRWLMQNQSATREPNRMQRCNTGCKPRYPPKSNCSYVILFYPCKSHNPSWSTCSCSASRSCSSSTSSSSLE